jgi:hypothetical protein
MLWQVVVLEARGKVGGRARAESWGAAGGRGGGGGGGGGGDLDSAEAGSQRMRP